MKRMMEVIPEEYYKGTGYLGLNCKTLLQILGAAETYALNPGHMIVQELLPYQVEALLDGSIFEKLEEERKAMTRPVAIAVSKDTQFMVAQPEEIPKGLISKLVKYFQSIGGDVQQAYLGQMQIPTSGQPPHLMIVLKLSEKRKRTFDQISIDNAPAIRSELGQDKLLDLFNLDSHPNLPVSVFIRFFPN